MTITEKVAYIKGLCAGLELDAEKKETKVINAIVELLDEMALSITDIEDDIIAMGDEIDAISDDLTIVEDELFEDDDDDDDDCDCCCDCDDDDDCDCCDEDFFEVECPNCAETLYVDDGVLEEGSLTCPGCGKEVLFQIVDDCNCDDDDCDCGCHDHD